MQLADTKHRKRMEINMTPMIDIVFLLLIFFMTCTQVSDVNREPLELPRLSGSSDQSSGDVTINVTAAGEYHVSGEQVNLAEIITLCGEETQRVHQGEWDRLLVVIRADRRTVCRPVNAIVTALTKLGITKVRLAVQTE